LAARRSIERFRQAVLAAACSRRLTADWREARGLGEWESGRAADVCGKVQSGSTPKAWYTETDGVPFLKVYNIVGQRLDFDSRQQFISPDLLRGGFARTAALPGDVLMNIVGPPLGKVAVVTDQYPAWSINQALTLFRPSERVSTSWLYIYLCSGISVAQVLNDTKGSVGQVNISLSQCRDFLIPVPTVEEQAEICHRVESLLALSDAVARRVSAASTIVDRSSRAVRSRAFRGELLPNEAEGAF
jgi:type I restriction enzyme S subunit